MCVQCAQGINHWTGELSDSTDPWSSGRGNSGNLECWGPGLHHHSPLYS
uniref:Macaca fascicularis brain cDNA clone: QflA-19628, similar to human follicle stimulating hormone, beta polypeptide (FSHB), mRNA, RefSeq: NM_000510.1 n=1 Tax=Macaca fascicularis TaxID=9541 RepID=I7GIG3_MACFA|nr:unnamed protein product [Macaca fascicularis]